MTQVSDDQVTTDQNEMAKINMALQEQRWNREREMMAMNHSRRTSLLKHYIETIEVAIKHIKEVDGLE